MMRRLLVPLLVVATLGLSAVPAFATTAHEEADERSDCLERADERLDRRARRHAAFAEELGMTAEEVSEAAAALLTDRLDEAVADGHLDQAQADEILERYQAGTLACSPILRARRLAARW